MLKNILFRIQLSQYLLFFLPFVLFLGFFLQFYYSLEVCLLCHLQRLCYFLLWLFSIMMHFFYKKTFLYLIIMIFLCIVGIFLSGWQIYLQYFQNNSAESLNCLPNIFYGWEIFGFKEFIFLYLSSSDCADIKFNILGLSIPVWSLFAFIIILILLIIEFRKKF